MVIAKDFMQRRIIQCVSLGIIAGFMNHIIVDVICGLSMSINANSFKQMIGNLLLCFIGLGIDLILIGYFL